MNPGLEPILPSQLIRKVINTRGADFTVRDLFKTFGSQSFGLIFIAMALPLTIPLPPLLDLFQRVLFVLRLCKSIRITQLWLPGPLPKRRYHRILLIVLKTKPCPCAKNWKKVFKSKQLNRLKESEIRLASIA